MRAGHSVEFIANAASPAPYFPTLAPIRLVDDSGRPVSQRSAPRSGVRLWRNLLSMYRALRRNRSEWDVVMASQSLTAWPVAAASTRARKFYYVQAYEAEFFEDKSFAYRLTLRTLARASYLLPLHRIVNAPMYLRYKWLQAADWVPPGIDFSVMHPAEQPVGQRPFTFGCIGRLEPWKGTADVVAAAEILRGRGFECRLRIAYNAIGSLPDNAELVVPRNDRELSDFYRSLDALVAPGTLQIGAPHYPVMEAMACGVPVVTTGYMPASAEQENAWIVPMRNAAAIADALIAIATDHDQRTRRVANALDSVREFGWSRVADRMLKIFLREASS